MRLKSWQQNKSNRYFSNVGGLPPQTQTLSSKAVFTTAYAVIPKTVMSDIVTSVLPHWDDTRAWTISRPLSGLAKTFAQYIMEVKPGGGSVKPEPDARASGAIFVVEGEGTVAHDGHDHPLRAGSFAHLPVGAKWAFRNDSTAPIRFNWVRKAFKVVDGDYMWLRSALRPVMPAARDASATCSTTSTAIRICKGRIALACLKSQIQ